MAKKKKVLTEEEELLTYRIMKNRNRQNVLLDKNGQGYQVSTKEIKQIKFFYNRYVIAIFLFLIMYSLKFGEALSTLVAVVVYVGFELVYQFLFKSKFNPIKVPETERTAFENSKDMIDFKRSSYISRGISGVLIGSVIFMGIFLREQVSIYDTITCYVVGIVGVGFGLYSLTQYLLFTKKNKA